MKKKMNRFWYLVTYNDLLDKTETKEMYSLYDELYEYFTADDLLKLDYWIF